MQVITSKENEKVKYIKKLKEKKYRDEYGKYIIEGVKIIEEAINEDIEISTIVICEECLKKDALDEKLMYSIAKYDCIYVTEKIFNSMTEVINPQGILAVVNKREKDRTIKYDEDVILILDNVQDPGNLGTILRTVDSVNIKQIILSNNTVDIYNPKVIRSTMGAFFRVNIIESKVLLETINEIKKHKYKVISTSLETNKNMYDIDFKKVAIVMGNEGNGVSKEVLEKSDEKVKIPILGKTESLNVSVATGVVLYEYVRRKML